MMEKKVYFESYGCSSNLFDLEVLLAHMRGLGYRISKNPMEADVLLINTCGVKKPTEDRVIARLHALSSLNKPLIVAGCLPKINFNALKKAAPKFSAILDPQSLDKTPSAVRAAERGERNQIFCSKNAMNKLEQPKIRLNPYREIISISEGCTGACTYCCVKSARGTLLSHPKEAIIERVRRAVSDGVKEVWITSQDNGVYGLDIGTNIAELLKECCRVNGEFLIRVGMMNPSHVLQILPELIEAYKDEKIFKFLHLPVQSGDNGVLRRMNREYTVEDFLKIVKSFREEFPEITISTDIICGFPGESLVEFEGSLKLVEEIQPDIVNISKFYPRPNTLAERMTKLDSREVKKRSRRLTELVYRTSLKRNRKWLGWEGFALVDETGKKNSWIARNFAYKPIVIKTNESLLGRFVRVKIVKAFKTHLEGEISLDANYSIAKTRMG